MLWPDEAVCREVVRRRSFLGVLSGFTRGMFRLRLCGAGLGFSAVFSPDRGVRAWRPGPDRFRSRGRPSVPGALRQVSGVFVGAFSAVGGTLYA